MPDPNEKVQIHGYVSWRNTSDPIKCQTCFAVLDIDSRITIPTQGAINAKLEWVEKPTGRFLRITEVDG